MSQSVIGVATAEVSVRPVRHAYAVPAGDADATRRVMLYAGTEWGGYAQPVVPLRADGSTRPSARAALLRVGPEVVVDVGDVGDRGSDLAARLDADHRSSLEHMTPPTGTHPLATIPRADLDGKELLVARDRADLSEVAALGAVYPGNEEAWQRAGAIETPYRDFNDLLDGQLTALSPLRAGRAQLRFIRWTGVNTAVVVFVGGMRLGRAIDFWHTRALAEPAAGPQGSRVIWLPRDAFADDAVVTRLRDLALQSWTDPNILLVGDRLQRVFERLDDAGFSHTPGTRLQTKLHLGSVKRDLSERPLSYRVETRPWEFMARERTYGSVTRDQVTVTSPTTTVTVESPVSFTPGYPGVVHLDIRGISQLEWPHRPEVARLIEANASWTPEGIGARYETRPTYQIKLAVPSPLSVLNAMLAARGWSWAVSDKGRYARALAERSGSDIDTLAHALALPLMRNLARLRTQKLEQVLTKLQASEGDAIADAAKSLIDLPPTWKVAGDLVHGVSKSKIMPVANSLLAAGLLRRAFVHACDTCGISSAVVIGAASEAVECEGCGARSVLRGPPGAEPTIVYALNSLLDTAVDQNAVEHVLAMRRLQRDLDVAWSLPEPC